MWSVSVIARGKARFGCAAILVLMALPLAAQARPCVHYWPQHVSIVGTLERIEKFGPPNYGENPKTDARYSVPILRLAQPLRRCADSTGDAVSVVSEIQVQLKPIQANQLIDRVVQVFGTMGPAAMAHDFTPVVCTPDSVILVSSGTRRPASKRTD